MMSSGTIFGLVQYENRKTKNSSASILGLSKTQFLTWYVKIFIICINLLYLVRDMNQSLFNCSSTNDVSFNKNIQKFFETKCYKYRETQ